MGKRSLKIVINIIFMITILFSINVYAVSLKASNLNELESIVLEQLNLTNSDFSIAYNGSIEGIDNTLRGVLEKDSYLKCTITSMEWITSNTANGNYNVNVKTNHILTAAQRKETDNKIDNILSKIIMPYMTDHEKVKAIHDYIIMNGEYDTTLEYYSDYNLLTIGKSVCNGYAVLTYNMLNKLNIPVKLVFGSSNSQSHVWNMIKLGDYWYHLDTTWDDPVPDMKNIASYNYYMKTDEEILKDHIIDGKQNLPTSKYKYYNYLQDLSSSTFNSYVYKSLLMETGLDVYNKENTADTTDGLSSILKQKIKFHPSKISVRYTKTITKDDINVAMSELFSIKSISEISYDQIVSDILGNYSILNLYIKYKETPDSITTDLSNEIYNIATKVNFNVYAVYGKRKENITKNVSIYPYDTNFINIYGNTLTFKDSGSQCLTLEYEGKKLDVNIAAINSIGFDYITDDKSNNPVNVKIYDKYIDFNILNQWPFIENGRTLVPLRAVFEVLNCKVSWDAKINSAVVEHGSTKIVIPASSKYISVNGTTKTLDVPAKLVNNRIMVPLRFIGEAINKIVIWDNTNSTVLIY